MQRVNYITREKKGKAVVDIKVQTKEEVEEFKTEDKVFLVLSKYMYECFRLTFTAKFHKGELFDNIGFFGDAAAFRQIVEGT